MSSSMSKSKGSCGGDLDSSSATLARDMSLVVADGRQDLTPPLLSRSDSSAVLSASLDARLALLLLPVLVVFFFVGLLAAHIPDRKPPGDIGEVDLIVCFDAQKSPIRLVQRMGRTGRKRQGRIVVILAEGREERTYNQSQSNKRSVYKSIVGDQNRFHMYPSSPRMLPPGATTTHSISGQEVRPSQGGRGFVLRQPHGGGPQGILCRASGNPSGFTRS
ncbi:hypothetical protein CRUP_029467 [Coryphaenoides rupestris]|nr:hypothetical protein CRUP_029467 [Coryphaenoides rupestris]